MAHLVKKKHPEMVLPNLGDSEKTKESGFVIPQDIPVHSWFKRGLDAALNQYGIRPGRHWDGVERSNGWFTSTILESDISYLPFREAMDLSLSIFQCAMIWRSQSCCYQRKILVLGNREPKKKDKYLENTFSY